MNSFDIDGVIYIDKKNYGVFPGKDDIIITGRSFEERPETLSMLNARGIHNVVHFNPMKFDAKTRESSGIHKALVLNKLKTEGTTIGIHFEDDEIQIEQIKKYCPWVNVVHMVHELTNKENVGHSETDYHLRHLE
jgi:predicted membrane protein